MDVVSYQIQLFYYIIFTPLVPLCGQYKTSREITWTTNECIELSTHLQMTLANTQGLLASLEVLVDNGACSRELNFLNCDIVRLHFCKPYVNKGYWSLSTMLVNPWTKVTEMNFRIKTELVSSYCLKHIMKFSMIWSWCKTWVEMPLRHKNIPKSSKNNFHFLPHQVFVMTRKG